MLARFWYNLWRSLADRFGRYEVDIQLETDEWCFFGAYFTRGGARRAAYEMYRVRIVKR